MSEEDIKLLKFLKALDNDIRIKLVEFILNYKEGDDFLVPPKVSPPIPRIPPPTNPSSILTVTDVTETVTKETRNIGEKMEQCWGFGMPCATEDDFCPYDEVEECKKRNEIVGVKK